jgi:tetratricopeptide (TPR) repeat protein
MADSSRIEELRRRVQLDPASIAFAALAEEYRRAGQFEDAIATCEAGLQRHPAYLSARVTLGRSLLELGRFEEARHELEHVLRAAPENLAAIRGLAEIHDRSTEYPDAAKHYASGDQPAAPPPEPASAPAPVPMARAPIAVSAPAPDPAPAAASAPIPVSAPAPIPVAAPRPVSVPAPAPVVHRPHPDQAALPALEAFLAAIVAARASSRS